MPGIRRRLVISAGVVALAAAGLVGSAPSGYADGMTVSDWASTQAQADRPFADPQNSSTNAGWADMAGGLTSRPYVTSLSVTNGDTTTQVMTAAEPTAAHLADGEIGAVVAPINLCPAGQAEQAGHCYATPNRVQIDVVYGAGDSAGWNFADPRVTPLTPAVTEDSVIDMTIALNSLGTSLRWTELNGHLISWKTENLGHDNATVRVRFRPATAPWVLDWPADSGCSATPIFRCELARADAEVLRASVLLSLDDTLDPALTGAAFATQNAVAGFLAPTGGAADPALGIQAASTHVDSHGALQRGTIEAFLPAGALLNLYGVLPSDAASFFSTARFDSVGTNDPPTYSARSESATQSEGVVVTVGGISFSTPRYQVKSKLSRTATAGKVATKATTVRATVAACTTKAPCTASIYRLTKSPSARFLGTRTAVLTNKTVTAKTLALAVSPAALKKGDRYLLVVRDVKYKRPIVSALGGVS